MSLNALGAIKPMMKLLHEWISADTPEDEPGWFQHTLMGLITQYYNLFDPIGVASLEDGRGREPGEERRFWETINKLFL